MARFFKTNSGVYVNADQVTRVRIKQTSHKQFSVRFWFDQAYCEDSDHRSEADAEAELAAFLEFANVPTVQMLDDCIVVDLGASHESNA